MSTYCLKVRVYYEDTDAGGIVYHARYLAFCERARTEILREKGIIQSMLLQEDLAFVVSKLTINYKSPARLDDLLSIKTELLDFFGASFHFRHVIINQHDQVNAIIEGVVAAISMKNERPVRIPSWITSKLK